MARTTPEEVLEIFPTNMDAGKILAFIAVATNLVTNVVAVGTSTPAMSTDELKEMRCELTVFAGNIVFQRDATMKIE